MKNGIKTNDLNAEGDEFLRFYVKDYPRYPKNPDAIIRKLCEEYLYNKDQQGRDILFMFHGWIMYKTQDAAEANVQHYLLKKRMDEIYNIVAKENHWDER